MQDADDHYCQRVATALRNGCTGIRVGGAMGRVSDYEAIHCAVRLQASASAK